MTVFLVLTHLAAVAIGALLMLSGLLVWADRQPVPDDDIGGWDS